MKKKRIRYQNMKINRKSITIWFKNQDFHWFEQMNNITSN